MERSNSAKACIWSKHFQNEDFVNKMQFDMKFATKLILKSDAVPSFYPQASSLSTAHVTQKRSVYNKREVARVRT